MSTRLHRPLALLSILLMAGTGCSSSPSAPSVAAPSVWGLAIVSLDRLDGRCPTTIKATGTITTSGTGTITYRWEMTGVGQSDTLSLAVGSSSARITTATPTYDLPAVGAGTYPISLHVLTPSELVVNGSFTMYCWPPAINGAGLQP
jgi:hypothetical protein